MPKATIMIVEDEPIIATYIEATLIGMGYAVCSTVPSGETALERLEEDHPDLVLMDILLEGELDGVETARRLREIMDIPVIFLTSHTDEHTVERAKLTDPSGYLVKPFHAREINIALDMALYRHRMERAIRDEVEHRRKAEEALQQALNESRQRNREVSALLGAARKVLDRKDFPQAAREIYETCKTLLGATAGYVAVRSVEGKANRILFFDTRNEQCAVGSHRSMPFPPGGIPLEGMPAGARYSADTGACDAVFPLSRDSFPHENEWTWFAHAGHIRIENVLFTPLEYAGNVVGVVALANKPGGFSDHDSRIATAFGELIAIALRNSRVMDALQESEQKFRTLFDHIPSTAFVIDSEHRRVAYNLASPERIKSQIGVKTPDLTGLPETVKDFWYSAEKQVIESGAASSFVEMVPLSEGYIYYETRLQPIKDRAGNVTMIIGISQDITDHKSLIDALRKAHEDLERRVEARTAELKAANEQLNQEVEERRRAEDTIQKSKAMLQKIFDGIAEPLVMLDSDGLVKMLNKAALDYYRLDDYAGSIGKPCYEAFAALPGPCPDCRHPFTSLDARIGTFERKGAKDPGRLEQVVVYPLKDEAGRHDATIVRISDITQAKMMERQLIQSEKLASLGLLVSGIAHEINNPNNFITFNIPILRDYLRELMPIIDRWAEAQKPDLELFGMSYEEFRTDIFKLVDNIEHGSARINTTVSGLRAFVSRKAKSQRRRVELKQVIEQGAAICRSEIRKRTRNFEISVPPGVPTIYTDPEALEQVLINLLINAAHASDKEDSWIRVAVRHAAATAAGSKKRVAIEVSDNGVGIEEDVIDKIFDPFFTTKSPQMGTGLGLYICHTLIEGIGGRIEVESRPGEGSTFRIVFDIG